LVDIGEIMSNVGKVQIKIPEDVNIELHDTLIKVKGLKGELSRELPNEVTVVKEDNIIKVSRKSEDKKARELHGLIRALISNMVQGVSDGFEKKLKMVGVGYKAQVEGDKITLNVGFSHPVEIEAPKGISFKVEKNTMITISGIDKELVGRLAAKIRAIKKPEPYKGKGIMYDGEKIRRKAGKALKSAGA